ncbi:hypothetical protein D9758_000561 [Tetrapyrgos nigripes]|uniref:Plant basic secretory protein n=1 Tax=Tetrapyrgos nigripes TaxID=182062 RepID=A0A8H5H1L6_9AGAR|nr:hypothetical protein D9758_000561 [Tetrapyrgos nigripes]
MPPLPEPGFPELSLTIKDLDHSAVELLYRLVGNPKNILKEGIVECLRGLYGQRYPAPNIIKVSVTFRSFPGVAYTSGSPHNPFSSKEIHFSLDHINNTFNNFKGSKEEKEKRTRDEIRGVLTHELVHGFQWDGKGSCPGGLIEGIADFIRLKASLAPPHWNRSTARPSDPSKGKWDAGYEKTAYFLDWIDRKYSRASTTNAPPPPYSTRPEPSKPTPSLLPGQSGIDQTCHPEQGQSQSHFRPGYTPVYIAPLQMPLPVAVPPQIAGGPENVNIVQKLNAWLRDREYDQKRIWVDVTGKKVNELWTEYCNDKYW